MRAAAAGAVTPASTQQVNIPGVSLGQYGSTGNQTDSLTTPASFDMQKYQGNVASNPAIAYQLPQIQAQQAQAEQAQAQARAKSQQEQIAIQEGLGRLDAQSRQQVVAATDTIGKAAGAVKMAAPEMKAQVYQSALQALASDPNPMVQKMIQGAPQQYTPQLDGQIDQWITHAMSISDIAERTNPKPSPGVNVPFSPDVQKQKVDIFTSGPDAKQINAGGVAMQHLAQLKKINDDNPLEVRTYGTKAYNSFHNLLDTVTDELMNFYGEPKTNEAIASKKKTLAAMFNRDAAISEQAGAMGAKFDEMEQKWKNAAPSSAYQAPLPGLSQKAKEARASLDPNYKLDSPTGGVSVTDPRGVTHTFPNQQAADAFKKAIGQ
jgi:hypothetical protein